MFLRQPRQAARRLEVGDGADAGLAAQRHPVQVSIL
jgi:hypothetical protein